MTAALEIQQASFAFPGGAAIFDRLDFRLDPGSFTAMIGPNGAGKTTMLNLLSGYLKPTTGTVLLQGQPLGTIAHRERAAILAVVPQNVFSPLPFTVNQVVEMGCLSRVGRFAGLSIADRHTVRNALETMGIVHLREREFAKLSGGERQRTLIATAIAQRPKIIILDEPTAHLDIGHATRLMKTLSRLNKETGLTILTISHDVQTVARFCRQTAIMQAGRIIAQGATDAILTETLLSEVYGEKLCVFRDPVHGRPAICPE